MGYQKPVTVLVLFIVFFSLMASLCGIFFAGGPFGYLLAAVFTIKGITMLTAISAMIIGQIMAGQKIAFAELIFFPAFNLLVIYCLFLILKHVKEPQLSHGEAAGIRV